MSSIHWIMLVCHSPLAEQINCQLVSCCCHQSLQSRFLALLAIYLCAPAMMPVVLATYWLTLPQRQAREWQWKKVASRGSEESWHSHLAKRGFFISFIWAGLLEDVSVVEVSLTKDRGPRGLCGIDNILWRITGWLTDIPLTRVVCQARMLGGSQNIRWYQFFS